MLIVIGQGIDDTVLMMTDIINILSRPQGVWINGSNAATRDCRLPPTCEMVNVSLPTKVATIRIREASFGKRLIASIIRFNYNTHWVAVIFDRRLAQLFVFDTLVPGRKERAGLALLAWR